MEITEGYSTSAVANGFAKSVESNSGYILDSANDSIGINIQSDSTRPSLDLLSGEIETIGRNLDSCNDSIGINIHSDSTRPSLDLLSEPQLCLELYNAAVEGDVKKVERLIKKNPERLSAAITEEHETVLHIAAGAKQTRFVKKMISNHRFNLQLKDRINYTAFCYAAMAGSKEIAEIMLEEDPTLLTIRGGSGNYPMSPLYLAVLFGHKEMSSYLFGEMGKTDAAKNELEEDKAAIVFASIDNTMYDIALNLIASAGGKDLATRKYTHGGKTEGPLDLLARTPLHLLHQSSRSDKTALLKRAIDLFCKSHKRALLKQAIDFSSKSHKMALLKKALELVELLCKETVGNGGERVREYFELEENKKILFDAARLGNYQFLAKLIRLYPDLGLLTNDKGQSIFHIAIVHRNRYLFGLIYEMGFKKQLVATYLDNEGNSILHLAAKYVSPYKSTESKQSKESTDQIRGPEAALEMQRELKLFEEVQLLVKPSYTELPNSKGKTPREVFTSSHASLLKQGEEWMRKTAESCMLVATLITTVVFAAAFSLPGGNDQVKGIPIHLKKKVFSAFSIVDAIALSASSISILIFWSILLSHYEEKDFLTSLPRKLVYGLSMLFISVASMMGGFGSSFFLAYSQGRITAIPILIAIIVCFPIILFVLLQYRLLKEVFYSSFRYRFSIKLKKC